MFQDAGELDEGGESCFVVWEFFSSDWVADQCLQHTLKVVIDQLELWDDEGIECVEQSSEGVRGELGNFTCPQ